MSSMVEECKEHGLLFTLLIFDFQLSLCRNESKWMVCAMAACFLVWVTQFIQTCPILS